MTKPKLTDVAYTIAWVLIAAVVIGGAYYQGRQDGWYVGANSIMNAITPAVGYEIERTDTKNFCFIDGHGWFPARSDGICYTADAPKD